MNTFQIEVIVLDGTTEIPDDQLVEYAAKSPDKFASYTDHEGRMNFLIGDERITFVDMIAHVVPPLALDVVPDLVEDGNSKLVLPSSPQSYYFESDGTTVTMTGNYMPKPLQFPQAELVKSAFDACKKLLTLTEQIWPGIGIDEDLAELARLDKELRPGRDPHV